MVILLPAGRASHNRSAEMCDYSLHSVKSRPAKVGDKLTTRDLARVREGSLHPKMRTSLSACYQEQSCPSSTRLGAYRPDCSFGDDRVVNHKTAIFRQINKP